MVRKRKTSKITFDDLNSDFNGEAECNKDEIESISLVVELHTEFDGVRELNLSEFLDGLSGDDLRSRRYELNIYANHIRKSKGSAESKYKTHSIYREYINHANNTHGNLSLASKGVVESYNKYIRLRVKKGELTKATLKSRRKQISLFLRTLYDLDVGSFDAWFPKPKKRTGKLTGARINDGDGNAKAYTQNDYKLILGMLLSFAKQYKKYHSDGVDNVYLSNNPFQFKYDKGLFSPVTSHRTDGRKYYTLNFVTICYLFLMIGITGANRSSLLRAKRKDIEIGASERDVIYVSLTCYRKGKLRIDPYPMKKFQLKFFEEIIEHSRYVDPSEDALLFPHKRDDETLRHINTDSVGTESKFFKRGGLVGEYGEVIYPIPAKLRETHGKQFDDLTIRAKVLGNSVKTSASHYSNGNPDENNINLQSGMNVYTAALLSDHDLSDYKKKYSSDIDVKVLGEGRDLEVLRKGVESSRTQAGGICSGSKSSPEAKRFANKISRLSLVDGESISCANILACFHCDNHVLVNSEEDIYVLLSLKQYLMDCRYSHEAGGLFGSRHLIDKTIIDIQNITEHKLDKGMVGKALNRIRFDGVHPIWDIE